MVAQTFVSAAQRGMSVPPRVEDIFLTLLI